MKIFKRILILVILLVLIILTVYLVGSYTQLSSVAVDYDSKIGSRYGNKDNTQYMVIGDDLNITMVDGEDIRVYYFHEYKDNIIKLKYNGEDVYIHFIDNDKVYNLYDKVMMYMLEVVE